MTTSNQGMRGFGRSASAIAVLFLAAIHFAAGAAFSEEDEKPPFYLGTVHSLSGWSATAGRSELNAINLAVDEINSNGGIDGRRIELVSEDNHSTFEDTVQAVERLASKPGLSVILGPNGADRSERLPQLAETNGVLLISASGLAESRSSGRTYFFSLLPDPEISVGPLADYIARHRYQEVALVRSSDGYHVRMYEAARTALMERDVTIGKVLQVDPEMLDYHRVVTELIESRAPAVVVFLPENGENASFLIRARAEGLRADIYGGSSLVNDRTVARNKSIAEGVVYFDYIPLATKAFLARYRREFGGLPHFSAPQAYDSVFLVKEAVEQCGPQHEQIMSCLLRIKHEGVSGEIAFNPEGRPAEPRRITALFSVKDGRVTYLK